MLHPKAKWACWKYRWLLRWHPNKARGIVTAETDENGKIYLNYATPKFGGKIDLTATLQTATGQSDTKQVAARVPGLVPLPNSSLYEKIGGTAAHHGPSLFSSDDDKHRGTSSFVNALTQVSREWNQSAEIGLIEFDQIPLHINDMSLKNGGLFDFKNNWSPPHKSHRVGTNADIGFKAIGPDGECKENLNRRDLRQRIFKATQIDPYEESDHFHIYVK